MVFSSLMMGIMQELGLHVTNFDNVNDELSMKSYVLIDEGVTFLMPMHSASHVVLIFWCLTICLFLQMFFGNKGDAEKMKTL